MQFKVPQSIDMEDKIVGPLTLMQFLYVIGGGILIYLLFQTIYNYPIIFWLLSVPIAAISLSLAFLKIQDQPLSHFISVGIQYLSKPKTRFWHNAGQIPLILKDAPKQIQKTTQLEKKLVEKSDLERLSNLLDTSPMDKVEQKNFGKITADFEKLIQQGIGQQKPNAQGGQSGAMGQSATTNR